MTFSVYDYFSIREYQVNLIKVSGTDISDLVNAVEAHIMDGVILTRISGNNAADYLKKKEFRLLPWNHVKILLCCRLMSIMRMQAVKSQMP